MDHEELRAGTKFRHFINKCTNKIPTPITNVGVFLVKVFGALIFFIAIYPNFVNFAWDIKSKVDSFNNKPLAPISITGKKEDVLAYKSTKNCFTDWINFEQNSWSGLAYNFNEVNGVYMLKDPDKKIDSVTFFSKPCIGGIRVEFLFTPYSETLINTDIYYGSWFRWEIGGNDLRSVRLFKNLDGCTAMKDVVMMPTINKFLPPGDKILVGKSVLATMSAFLTKNGKLRTELDLQYTSSVTNKLATYTGKFYYEFDVDLFCDQKTVLDINKDFNFVGIGLQLSKAEGAESPRIKFEKFKASVYQDGQQ